MVPGLELARTVLPQTILEKDNEFLRSAKSVKTHKPVVLVGIDLFILGPSGYSCADLQKEGKGKNLPKGR